MATGFVRPHPIVGVGCNGGSSAIVRYGEEPSVEALLAGPPSPQADSTTVAPTFIRVCAELHELRSYDSDGNVRGSRHKAPDVSGSRNKD
jgi:hypothetical protein